MPVLHSAQRDGGSPATRHPQNGVALIITLILLSVVTFMAITFLALSRRERSAVTTVTDTASARLAADAALANAEAQVIANVFASTNPFNFTLLVSTNYINPFGFLSGSSSPTNVNYYNSAGNFITGDNFLQNLNNLYFSPRAPVFIPTNSAGSNDFRFYLDLNRNGLFDTNGIVAETNFLGQPSTNFEVGDPEWIGVLERPDAPHGPNNKFIARYAFIALPIGNTLDLNAIYNQAMTRTVNSGPASFGSDGFLRNQGVGSWEINLAAFLTDLNPNQWDTSAAFYNYRECIPPPNNLPNSGRGFEDALSLLSYRYGYNYYSLTNAAALLNGALSLANGNIDGYSDWLLMTTPAGINVSGQDITWPWAGADNTNHFFTPEELFNSNEISAPFVNSLLAAGNTNSTYDRYTFYRLLSQLGTDSAPESGKMNLNYDNLDPDTNGVAASTNFMAWQPLAFFTNAADRLLRAYTTQWRNSNPVSFATNFYSVPGYLFTNANFSTTNFALYPAFGIGNIPVWVSNQFVYSSAVNRLLQLAANIYDATTNNTFALGKNYPSVFRPLFTRDGGGLGTNLFITGYVLQTRGIIGQPPGDETNAVDNPDLALPIDASVLATTNNSIVVSNWAVNVYGVPWIIGAKKGFPNFNEFSLESVFQITRKLQFTRNTNTSPFLYASNQMYIMSINNFYGVECWNSYTNSYPKTGIGPVAIMARVNMSISLTNDDPLFVPVNKKFMSSVVPTINSWPGNNNSLGLNPFVLPFSTNSFVLWLTNSVYNYGPNNMGYSPLPGFIPTSLDPSNYINSGTPPLPHFGLLTTNRLQVAIIDYSPEPGIPAGQGRIIDYVQLNGMDRSRDLNAEIATPDDYGLWSTNLTAGGEPIGVDNQVNYSRNGSPTPDDLAGESWSSAPIPGLPYTTQQAEQTYFNKFFGKNLTTLISLGGKMYTATYTSTNIQAPFTPIHTRVQRLTWQANDPLVHYMTSDLTDTIDDTNVLHTLDWTNWPAILGQPNHRYMPWGGYPGTLPNANAADFNTANARNMTLKDPLVSSSDSWDFPTNKFPTVGWLGRVHRGTPWQTVYLKASPTGTTNWMTWTGNQNLFDAINAAPGQDRLLFDLFTTAFNDNATRGTLSVNVGPTNANLAAWSALFAGVVVPTDLVGGYTIINPAGLAGAPVPVGPPPSPNSPLCLGYLVQNGTNGINDIRTRMPGGVFAHVGDILAVSALTEQSPFLAGLNPNTQISDEMYEWLPQQTMSLLRCSSSPRYVIYCYGQTLKPAPNGIYTGSGPFFGMVTNYQVVSEIATRAVVRFNSAMTNVVTSTNDVSGNPIWFAAPVVTNNNAVIESFNILPPD